MYNANGVRVCIENFWKLVSKDIYPKLEDCALKCNRFLETHTFVRVYFVQWSKSNLKTEIELQTKHWTIVSDLHH